MCSSTVVLTSSVPAEGEGSAEEVRGGWARTVAEDDDVDGWEALQRLQRRSGVAEPVTAPVSTSPAWLGFCSRLEAVIRRHDLDDQSLVVGVAQL